jgi:hypothetical protein|tara:strand:+ start:174 stop:443 length:270 start_codon:yes stop_codon:yes gene_type:complete
MSGEELKSLTQVIVELKGQIERMAERQDEMLDDVKQIKKAVYDPDSGIYARLRILEQWKETTSKIQWAMIMSLISLFTAAVYKLFIDLP